MPDPYPCVGGTYTFRTYLVQNGNAYNLTGLTVTFILTDPTGLDHLYSATVEDAVNGLVSYTTVKDVDITLTSKWSYYWKVTGTSAKGRTRPKSFFVNPVS